jgi:dTDP-4-amino-4,6-dideoxygalactose transaminase
MIPIALPVLGEAEAEAARAAVLSGWITQGPEVAAFEAEFAKLVGAPHACAVSNCTTALHLALQAAGVHPGDEVITVSHSFIATANAIGYCGASPVFVDIDPETFNISPAAVEEAITPLTRAILCVHQMGMPCDLASLRTIADAHGLPLIEDAACAAGSEILIDGRWRPVGGPVGDIACFSFHPRKVITTGEGGMLTTRNAEFDARFRLWRQHGMNVSDRVRHATPLVIFESYPTTGYNYRMTDIQAAIGRRQLQRLPDILAHRRRLADHYAERLSAIVQTPVEPVWAKSNWQSYCVRLPDRADQKTVMQSLLDEGVASRRGIMCSHREAAWEALPLRHRLVQSERAQDGCVLLPLYAQMTDADQDRVVEGLRRGLSNSIGRSRTPSYAAAT